MSQKRASIIIPTKDKLLRLLLVMQGLDRQIDDNVEVIIVFDGCHPDMVKRFNETTGLSFTPVVVISEKNIGRAAARNMGLRTACGKIIIFLDDDRIPCPDFVARHLNGHSEKCVLLGERKELYCSEEEIVRLFSDKTVLNDFEKMVTYAVDDFAFSLFRNITLGKPHSRLRWVPFYTGNVSVEKQDLEAVGLFDESYNGWGYEDTDLGYRLCKRGLPFIKEPLLVNYHLVHQENPQSRKQDEQKNQKQFLQKYSNDREVFWVISLLVFFRKIAIFKHICKQMLTKYAKYRKTQRLALKN